MSKLILTRSEKIYINPEVRVTIYKGKLSSSSLSQCVIIKEQIYDSVCSANQAIHESMAMASLEHPAIVKIYDCQLLMTEEKELMSIIVLEQMETDLEKEITKRNVDKRPWSEAELLNNLRQLVSALSLAQSKGISHRDIKPQNIFITGSQLKIGDFGSSASNLLFGSVRQTLQGSPFFLSPELKREYVRYLQEGVVNVQYDPVKSDVYSLGVTFVYMAQLSPPEALTNIDNLKAETEKLLQDLPQYANLMHLLRYMLEVDSNTRPSFEQLDYYFKQYETFYQSLICGERIEVREEEQASDNQAMIAEQEQPCCEPEAVSAPEMPAENPPLEPPSQAEISDVEAQQSSILRPDCQMPLNHRAEEEIQQPQVQCVLCGKRCVSAKEGQDICLVCVNTRVNYPPCCICSQPIREKFIFRGELFGELMALADACCSYGCLLSLKQILNAEKCVNCSEPSVLAKQVILRCNHKFHNKDCLFAFMLKSNPRFADLNKNYQCPFCKHPICFENEIKTAFAEGELEERMDKERIFMCAQCSSLEVIYVSDDERMYCRNCFERQQNIIHIRFSHCPYHSYH